MEAKAPVGSRWKAKLETKGRVFVVIERKPFGVVEIKQEDRAYFGRTTLKGLLANFERMPLLDQGVSK